MVQYLKVSELGTQSTASPALAEGVRLGNLPLETLAGLGQEEPHGHQEECLPRSELGAYLLHLSDEVTASIHTIRTEKPPIVTHPLRRMHYLKEVAQLAGQRMVLNQLARYLVHGEE